MNLAAQIKLKNLGVHSNQEKQNKNKFHNKQKPTRTNVSSFLEAKLKKRPNFLRMEQSEVRKWRRATDVDTKPKKDVRSRKDSRSPSPRPSSSSRHKSDRKRSDRSPRPTSRDRKKKKKKEKKRKVSKKKRKRRDSSSSSSSSDSDDSSGTGLTYRSFPLLNFIFKITTSSDPKTWIVLGPLHTRHFCSRYCDKNIFFFKIL